MWSCQFSATGSNGLASSCKLKTWVFLRLSLARPCMHLHWLVLSLVEIKFVSKLTKVSMQFEWHPSYYPMKYGICLIRWLHFGHTGPIVLKCAFLSDLHGLSSTLASLLDPPIQVSAQVQFAATCDYLWVCLVKALKQNMQCFAIL